MRSNNQNKRSRGRSGSNRRHGGSNPLTRNYESNGPDVKVRGNASTIAEKYVQLARDAHSSGDSVLEQSYLQFAEHYSRIILAAQAYQQAQNQQRQEKQQEQQESQTAEAEKAKSNKIVQQNSENSQATLDEKPAKEAIKSDGESDSEKEITSEKPAQKRERRRPRQPMNKTNDDNDKDAENLHENISATEKTPKNTSELPAFLTEGSKKPSAAE